MTIESLNGKKVCILGFGKEGRATLDAINKRAPQAEVTVADKDASVADAAAKHWWQVGEGWLQNLEKFDVLIVSPGIPPTPEIEKQGAKVTNATQLFLDSVPQEATVIGVTGTKGKSTTSSLIAAILKAAGKETFLVGNIGEPSLLHLDEVKASTTVVMEMSSYQLRMLTRSPKIAVITSFFPEHLDYHGSVEAYMEAKMHITRFQGENDAVFYAGDNEGAIRIAQQGKGMKMVCHPENAPVKLTETKLLGAHNLSNIALAWKVAEYLCVEKDKAIESIRNFQPLPHRLQSLGIHHGIEWVDDAISTTPESAVAALDALGPRVATMLLGGQDRGVDFAPLIYRLSSSSVKNVVLFPGSGERIAKAMDEAHLPIVKFPVTSMEEAVKLAILHTQPQGKDTPIVLLSPASPSYGMFKNFEEKGDAFAGVVSRNPD